MKDYQRERLEDLLRFIDRSEAERFLVITLPDNLNEIIKNNQKEFLKELRSFYSVRKMQIDEYPIDALQSMWDDRYYDIILLRYVLWTQRKSAVDPGRVLRILSRHLTPGGRIVVLENNGIGIRTLAGDRYDGMYKEKGLRRSELCRAVSFAGLYVSFYYPHPYSEDMEYLFSDARLPAGERLGLSVRETEARMEFYPEEQLALSVAEEKLFPSMANQFLCFITASDIPQALLYRQYLTHRDRRLAVTKSLFRTAGGRLSYVYEPVSDAAAPFVKSIYDNFQKLQSLYKGYTLQISPCAYDSGRLIALVEQESSLEEQLDEALREEDTDRFIQLIHRLSDIMTAPTRIASPELKGGVRFSGDPGFIRIFGDFFGNEEDMLRDELILPISLLDGTFSDFTIKDKRWTLAVCMWTVDFPVPFSFVLYRMLRRYFDEASWRDPGQETEKRVYDYFSITEQMQNLFFRMNEHMEAYLVGRAMTMERIRAQCLAGNEFLPVGEIAKAFLDGDGNLPSSVAREYENADAGFLDKVKGLCDRIFGSKAL